MSRLLNHAEQFSFSCRCLDANLRYISSLLNDSLDAPFVFFLMKENFVPFLAFHSTSPEIVPPFIFLITSHPTIIITVYIECSVMRKTKN